MAPHDEAQSAAQAPALSNAEIADRLAGLAQLLSTQKENPYKVKAYHRAAARIRSLSESLDELVREDADLTQFRWDRRSDCERDPGNCADRKAQETGYAARAGGA